MAESRGSRDSRESGSWHAYIGKFTKLHTLWVYLFGDGYLEGFPYKNQLEGILDGLNAIQKYQDSIVHYRPAINRAQETLDNIYDFIGKLRKNAEEGFGKHFKTNSRVSYIIDKILEKENKGDEESILERGSRFVREELEKYKPSASPLDIPIEKEGKKKEKKLVAEIVAITLIVVLSFGFANLRYTSNAQFYAGYTESQIPTGSFFLPMDIAGLSFEAVYILLASAVIAIYILGKLMKRW